VAFPRAFIGPVGVLGGCSKLSPVTAEIIKTLIPTRLGILVGIPIMPTGKVRSLNLATSVGVVLYEALRQLHDW
jgi:hypothetical protein